DACGVGGKDGTPAIPSGGQVTPLHQVDFGRELRIFRSVSREQLGPTAAGLGATGANPRGEAGAHGVRDQELGVLGPAVVAFGEGYLLLAPGLALRRGGVLLFRAGRTRGGVPDG